VPPRPRAPSCTRPRRQRGGAGGRCARGPAGRHRTPLADVSEQRAYSRASGRWKGRGGGAAAPDAVGELVGASVDLHGGGRVRGALRERQRPGLARRPLRGVLRGDARERRRIQVRSALVLAPAHEAPFTRSSVHTKLRSRAPAPPKAQSIPGAPRTLPAARVRRRAGKGADGRHRSRRNASSSITKRERFLSDQYGVRDAACPISTG